MTLSDDLRISPATMNVPAGKAVTFVVTNAGAITHEFYLGNEQQQQAHETEMGSMGGMMQDDASGISVEAGATKQLVFTFTTPGATLAGCHEPGHYAGGMKAAITVSG